MSICAALPFEHLTGYGKPEFANVTICFLNSNIA